MLCAVPSKKGDPTAQFSIRINATSTCTSDAPPAAWRDQLSLVFTMPPAYPFASTTNTNTNTNTKQGLLASCHRLDAKGGSRKEKKGKKKEEKEEKREKEEAVDDEQQLDQCLERMMTLGVGRLSLGDISGKSQLSLLKAARGAAAACLGAQEVCAYAAWSAADEWLAGKGWLRPCGAGGAGEQRDGEEGEDGMGAGGSEKDDEEEEEEETTRGGGGGRAWYRVEQGDMSEQEEREEADVIRRASADAFAVAANIARGKGVAAAAAAAAGSGSGSGGANPLAPPSSSANAAAAADAAIVGRSASERGVWNYVIGLIGKPSAGKSTFFNAATRAALERGGRKLAEVR